MNLKKALTLGCGACLVAACFFIRPLRFVENIFYDLHFSRAAASNQDSVVIVGIDPESIGAIGAWPWPRSTIAACIEKINTASPAALAVDILFPKRPDDSAGSAALAKALCNAGKLVLPFRARSFSSNEQGITAAPQDFVYAQRLLMTMNREKLHNTHFFRADCFDASDSLLCACALRGGVINVTTSTSTQKLRQVVQIIQNAEEYYPSFSLSAAAAFLQCKPDELALDGAGFVRVKDRRVPLSTYAATTPVHFRGRSGAIITVPASRVLSDPAALSVLHNKLVFVGVTDAATGVDFFTTPAGSQFPGVEMWATAALDILQKSWIREEAAAPDVCNLAWALLMFPGLLLVPGLKKGALLAAVSVMAALSIGAGPLCMRSWLYFWNPVYHIVAWVACVFMVAARKNIPFFADEAPLDFSAPGGPDAAALPVYRPEDFLQTLPQAQSALFVAEKLGIASGAGTQKREACAVTVIGGKASMDGTAGTGAGVVLTKEESARFGALCGGRIVKLLGSGGMADVYLVWNPRLEVYRAVKVMQPGRPEAFRERFETEIRILSKLMHPNIVQFFSVGEWEGLAFIEMEYVQGAALDNVCEQCGLLSPPEAMAVGILTCRALHYAHTQPTTIYGAAYTGVIHRDLKPANIMVSKNGMIKLADFGIARPEEVSLHTMDAGKVVGTLPYLAPEQFDGAQLTARIDLYALGTTLYELVSGERAFPQTEMSSLIKAKALGMVKPLPSHVPKQLAAIINKAMEIKPETRYESARSMGGDLEKALRSFAGAKGYAILQGLAKRFNG